MRLASLGLTVLLVASWSACASDDDTAGSADLSTEEAGDGDEGGSTNAGKAEREPALDPNRSYGARADAGVSSGKAPAPPRADSTGGASHPGSEQPPTLSDRPPALVNPFVDATKDPFSTFGADVDTASYDLFRQSLQNRAALPNPEQVRVEDFINYFDYDYPVPTADAAEPFAIALAAAPHPLGSSTTLLRVGIQAKAAPVAERKPVNLVFLVDVSGSMASSDKLPLAQRVMTEAISVLAPTDTISIVSYASDTRVRLAPTLVSARASIEPVIAALTAGGSTNGASGIDLAYAQASAGFVQGGINHVVLCTDGDFNLGITSDEALVTLIKTKRASGITLTALGFGRDNLNDAMMEKVSNAGNGSYSVVYSADQAVAYANQRLLGTIFHVAKDMKLQVELNPALVSAYRLLGYESRAIADTDFRNDVVDGGEVGAEHRVTALYELVLTGQSVPTGPGIPTLSSGEASDVEREVAASELVRVKVRYKEVTATDADPAREVVRALEPSAITQAPDADFRWAAALATLAEVLRSSPYWNRGVLAKVAELVNADPRTDPDRVELRQLVSSVQGILIPTN